MPGHVLSIEGLDRTEDPHSIGIEERVISFVPSSLPNTRRQVGASSDRLHAWPEVIVGFSAICQKLNLFMRSAASPRSTVVGTAHLRKAEVMHSAGVVVLILVPDQYDGRTVEIKE